MTRETRASDVPNVVSGRAPFAAAVLLSVWALASPDPATAQEREVRLSGPEVAMYNLAGQVTLAPGSGDDVRVFVRPTGPDADRLRIEAGTLDGSRASRSGIETLRVVYPADRILYRGSGGSTSLRVREDGTFWGDRRGLRRGREVRISRRSGDFEAHADLDVEVPPGKRVLVMLATGLIEARNVEGDLHLDTGSGNIRVDGAEGDLSLDTGSGDVSARDVRGDLVVDTGSGDVTIGSVRGDRLHVDTGSGSVSVDGADASEVGIDTGSGDVVLMAARSARIGVDTGSGDVRIETVAGSATIGVDTGSGDVELAVPDDYAGRVRLETSSGRLRSGLPITLERKTDDVLEGRIGDGGMARIEVDTGSGDVTLRRS